MRHSDCLWFLLAWSFVVPATLGADRPTSARPTPGSLIEDRAAAKLLEAGKARYEADEPAKAVEIWQSVIERYPRSRVRFATHLVLGNHFLDRERAYERGRVHFEVAASEENRDEEQRAEAMMRSGVCYYHLRNFGKCFGVMRDVIDKFPGSPVVNDAWYHIGLGHFQLGHYGRAIAALENVGTAVTSEKGKIEKLEAGKRLFVRIEDADLAILGPQQPIDVLCQVASGDRETIQCFPISRNARLAIGSAPTQLGTPAPDNGRLEIKGDDTVTITYVDQHTADKQTGKVAQTVKVVGTADVRITDGAFRESLMGAVLGKELNLQVNDGDRDLTDGADSVTAVVLVYRAKTEEQLQAEELQAEPEATAETAEEDSERDTLREIDRCQIVLTEVRPPRNVKDGLGDSDAQPTKELKTKEESQPTPTTPDASPAEGDGSLAAAPKAESGAEELEPDDSDGKTDTPTQAEEQDDSVHSGVFRVSIPLEKAEEAVADDDKLQAFPGDVVKIVYLDERHRGEGSREVTARARCLEGNIGAVRISHAQISDQELRIQTQLKTASALTNIGNRYKEFGLRTNAEDKYKQALGVCEEIMNDAAKLGGRVLEQTYVQLWRIYFEMERLDLAAAMCQRLQRQFPSSGFVDEALLQLAEVARKQNDLPRAIQTYSSLLAVRTSPLRGEAQFGIAQCYDQMAQEAKDAESRNTAGLRARAFEAYKKVLDQFPDSGRVGDAVAKLAAYYYDQKDYARAVEVFENVLLNYPDAKFLDVILFNYGRCLYRMGRKPLAVSKFEQLLAEFPDSSLAADTKKIIEAMRNAGT